MDDKTTGGTIPIPKNLNSGSVGYFGGIGTGIGIKGIVKGLEVGRFRFLKNRDSDSLAHFGGIGTRIRIKGIVKGLEVGQFRFL